MKREHPYHPNPNPPPMAAASTSNDIKAAGKAAMWEDDGMDELLAVLGYKVKSSNMADVAQKLEQLEEFMGTAQEDGLSHLASDTVHYNPSDLSTWLESMITEITPPNFDPLMAAPPPMNHLAGSSSVILDDPFLAPAESSTITSIDFADQNMNSTITQSISPRTHFEDCSSSDYELKAIPGKAIFSQTQFDSSPRDPKRLKSSTDFYSTSSSIQPVSLPLPTESSPRPVIVVDSQENGVRLVHGLMACAEAVQQNNLNLAKAQ